MRIYGGISRRLTAAAALLTVSVLTALSGGCTGHSGPMSPYAEDQSFLRGATWVPTGTPLTDLRRMRDEFHIDTITVYDLRDWPTERLSSLFTALRTLDMRLVVRLESYDPATFAFTADDAARVVGEHEELLAATRGNDRVAYVCVNLPIDDPRVQSRLGGVNSSTSKQRQVDYAGEITRLIRERTGAPIYLGLFYGWDGGFATPSYRDSGADGYVLTSYSYPGKKVADSRSDTAELIDEPRLRSIADRAVADHPGSPIVVEYGFQTLTGHDDRPAQSAGLVRDASAKRAALLATTRFYRENYPAVTGTVYFGFNVHKAEGDPPRTLDFGLIP